jgi:hypothetical protein
LQQFGGVSASQKKLKQETKDISSLDAVTGVLTAF